MDATGDPDPGDDRDAAPDETGTPDTATGRPGVANFLAALAVRRLAVVGFGLGLVVTAAIYVALGGAPTPAITVVLLFTLVVTTGLLFTAILVAANAVRLVRRLD